MHGKKRIGKKGQEGISATGALAAILILVVVVVLIILGVTGYLGPIFGFKKYLPVEIGNLAKACDGYVQLSSRSDYCAFRDLKISGKTEYLNCEDTRVQKEMGAANKGALICDENAEVEECVVLMGNKIYNVKVNGNKVGNNNTENKKAIDYCNTISGFKSAT